MTSADQDDWLEIAQAIRAQLRKYTDNIPGMNPGEVKDFVESVNYAYWLEVHASSFDKEVDLQLARTVLSD